MDPARPWCYGPPQGAIGGHWDALDRHSGSGGLPGRLRGAPPRGEQVPLLTGTLSCYAGGEGGPTAELTVDSRYGTNFAGRPVMWPSGYTGWRVGSVVEVRDSGGNLKATTGRSYHISHANASVLIPDDDGSLGGFQPANAFPAAADCPYHHDFIDCTANPTDTWCKAYERPTVTDTPPP